MSHVWIYLINHDSVK